MKRAVPDRLTGRLAQKRLLQFLFFLLLVASFAWYASQILKTGGVWPNHLADGLLFVRGSIPALPAYPMWGYSLLAGVFKENITIFQGMLMLVVCVYWYRSILRFTTAVYPPRRLIKIITNPFFVGTMLAPFIFLSLSYFSNSMAYILAFCGAWVLHLAVEGGKDKSARYYATSGLLIGLGFNFRSEIILLGVLLFFALLIYGVIKRSKGHYLRMGVVFCIPLFLATLPWVVYTGITINQPRISSTNGGTVMYLGLGVLPNNPWNVVDNDPYAIKIADENNLDSAWSADADRYFKRKYLQAIKDHPGSFAKRVLIGWRLMLTQGLHIPDARGFFYSEKSRDGMLLDYLNEELKLALGLNVNEREREKYIAMGITSNDLSLRHYSIVALDYFSRFVYLGVFILLLGACMLLSLKTKFNSFISLIFAAHLVFLLFVAGFIQTHPRHTTLLLPISLSTIIVFVCKPTRKEAGDIVKNRG